MKNKKRRRDQKKGVIIVICDTIIVLLCIILIVSGFVAVQRFYETGTYHYSEDSFYYRLEDGNYASMVEMYYMNEAGDVPVTGDLKEYYGIAKYFEAASYYKMYLETGDHTHAETQKQKMEAALAEMGDFASVKKDINNKLNITE